MVMVLGQVLGQLEPGELVTGSDASDQPDTLKIDQVPVGGASRYLGEFCGDVRDAHRMAVRYQQLDDGSSTRRVTQISPSEAHLYELV
jgi:hypothetical protein